jgi:transcriptional regulator with XRE-family HTH domain
MTPRKPPKRALGDVLASSIKDLREDRGWTQEQLAERMQEAGFTNWARSTVTEVEGSGRRRQVSVAELIGLAHVFGAPVFSMLWPTGRRLEVSPALTFDRIPDLLDVVVGLEALKETSDNVARELFAKERGRVNVVIRERVGVLVDEMRMLANWFEDEAVERLTGAAQEKEEDK